MAVRVKGNEVNLLVLQIGPDGSSMLADAMISAGAESIDIQVTPATTEAVDGVLDRRQERRLVVEADLAGLNLVLSRLMHRDELDTAETAVLLKEPVAYLTRMGMPDDRESQLQLAVRGDCRLAGVMKDDSGGLAVDSACVVPWPPGFTPLSSTPLPGSERAARLSSAAQLSGSKRAQRSAGGARSDSSWWLRAVVDDQRLCDGSAHSVSIQRLGPSELEATLKLGRFRRRTQRGRALQLACDEAQIVTDGIVRNRPRSSRVFWSEPKLWRLALP